MVEALKAAGMFQGRGAMRKRGLFLKSEINPSLSRSDRFRVARRNFTSDYPAAR